MRVLVIGGSGFIGPHVVRALLAGEHAVTVLHRGTTPAIDGTRELIGDRNRLRDSTADVRALAPDVVVDCILSSSRQARELIDLCRGITGRLVALSSCDVYRACGVLHRTEPGPLQPLPLTESSALRSTLQTYSEDALRHVRQIYQWIDDDYDKIPVERTILGDAGLPGTVLRLPMVYGPGDPLHRFRAVLKRMTPDAERIPFEEKYAAFRSPRGYVENVGDAIALAATSPRAAGRIYNVAEAESITELEWAQRIAAIVGWRGTFDTVPFDDAPEDMRVPGNLDQHWVVDSTRIRDELGYHESTARDEALRRTVDWERSE